MDDNSSYGLGSLGSSYNSGGFDNGGYSYGGGGFGSDSAFSGVSGYTGSSGFNTPSSDSSSYGSSFGDTFGLASLYNTPGFSMNPEWSAPDFSGLNANINAGPGFGETSYGQYGAPDQRGFWDKADPWINFLGMVVPGLRPLSMMYSLGRGAYKGNYGDVARGALTMGGVNPAFATLAGAGVDKAMGKDLSKGTVQSAAGNAAGYMTGNPVVATGASYLAGKAFNGSPAWATPGFNPQDPAQNYDNILQPTGSRSLADMYFADKVQGDFNKASKTALAQQTDLSSMFGPNSAYAQQLRQQLERRDAAAGRRSQYGPREVELQAKLAELQARSAPAIQQANLGAQNQALQAKQAARAREAQQLNALLGAHESGMFNDVYDTIGGWFS